MKSPFSRESTRSSKPRAYRSNATSPQQVQMGLYEVLKSRYTANAENSAEYEAAVRRAALEAGV